MCAANAGAVSEGVQRKIELAGVSTAMALEGSLGVTDWFVLVVSVTLKVTTFSPEPFGGSITTLVR